MLLLYVTHILRSGLKSHFVKKVNLMKPWFSDPLCWHTLFLVCPLYKLCKFTSSFKSCSFIRPDFLMFLKVFFSCCQKKKKNQKHHTIQNFSVTLCRNFLFNLSRTSEEHICLQTGWHQWHQNRSANDCPVKNLVADIPSGPSPYCGEKKIHVISWSRIYGTSW